MKNIKRGDVYYADLDPVVGSEQNGRRPVLIIQNNVGNKHSPTVIVAIITSKRKAKLPTHVEIHIPELPLESMVMLEQLRTIDKQRLECFIGTLDKKYMSKVEIATQISLGIIPTEETA